MCVCVCVCVCVRMCVCVETTTELLFTILLSVCVLSAYYVCVCVTNTHPITHIYHYSRQISSGKPVRSYQMHGAVRLTSG